MADEQQPPPQDKWPWSVTDREFGALEQELKEVRHDLRNLKTIVDNSGASYVTKQDVIDMRENLSKLNQVIGMSKGDKPILVKLGTEFSQFKAKVYTAFSVVIILAGAVAWLIDFVLRIASND